MNTTGKAVLGLSLLGLTIYAFRDKRKFKIISKNPATKEITFKIGNEIFTLNALTDSSKRFGPEHPSLLPRVIFMGNSAGGYFNYYENNKMVGKPIEVNF